mmetsp:Transcript_136/g.654  ORF Transcript_136/g.654 Transcript_136/m.654 type:complete len:547 (+) Transcript_136:47-1687(+)
MAASLPARQAPRRAFALLGHGGWSSSDSTLAVPPLSSSRRTSSSSSALATALSATVWRPSSSLGGASVAAATRLGRLLFVRSSSSASASSPPLSVSSGTSSDAASSTSRGADPALCAQLASSVDSRTAAGWALTFSRAAGAAGAAEKAAATGEAASSFEASSSSDALARPEGVQMRKLFVRTAIPFVGFGFFDNVIMLTVGETLDCTLGVAFGFSTLAAAGMGQMVSDASGITLQGLIERFADRLGLSGALPLALRMHMHCWPSSPNRSARVSRDRDCRPDPHLTLAQQRLDFVRYFMIVSRIVGIVFGCFLGMVPLIFMPDKKPRLVDQIAEKLAPEKRAEFQSLVSTEEYLRGDHLLNYGTQSSKVFMIQDGTVEVVGRDLDGLPFAVCTIGPGHSFGVPELNRPSHVDLVAKDVRVVAQVIEKADFLRITAEDEEGVEVFKKARNTEHQVYLRSQGQSIAGAGKTVRAEKGAGKTRMFAGMSMKDKLKVLSFVTADEKKTFTGAKGEGKVGFFANLSEDQKREALVKWQGWKAKQTEQTKEAS